MQSLSDFCQTSFASFGYKTTSSSAPRRLLHLNVWLTSALFALSLAPALSAKPPASVQYLGSPKVLFPGQFLNPAGVAADAAGNIYIADAGNLAVYKETLQSDGSYVSSIVSNDFAASPVALTVDTSGNVYVGLQGTSTTSALLKETLQSDGSYIESPIGTGLTDVYGVAVDSIGNVYATNDGGNPSVVKLVLTDGSYTSSTIYTNGTNQLGGMAIDSNGNLFVPAVGTDNIFELTPVGNSLTTAEYESNPISVSGASIFAVAVDASGNLYLTDQDGYLRLETFNGDFGYTDSILASNFFDISAIVISPAGTVYFSSDNVYSFSAAPINLGAGAVGVASPTSTLNFSIQSGIVVGAVNVVTQGTTSSQSGQPEFSQSNNASCTPQTYSQSTVCSVSITLTPSFPGLRTGALQFLDGNGNLLSSTYLYGTGTAPLAAFSPAIVSQLPISLVDAGSPLTPSGPVVDAAGNIFFADTNNNRIVEVSQNGNASVLTLPGITLSLPSAVAIDGAGNLYIADANNSRVVELTPQGVASVLDAGAYDISSNFSVAADSLGNVYTTDSGNNQVLEFPSGGKAVAFPTGSIIIGQVSGVAADGFGNVFIADAGNAQVVEVNSLGVARVVSTGSLMPALGSPSSVSVDASGNLYIYDGETNRVVEVPYGSSNGFAVSTSPGLLVATGAVAPGNLGDLYIADAINHQIVVVNQASPISLTLKSPGDSQSIQMLNLGNAPLDFSVPVSGNNPSFGTAAFGLANAGLEGACPQLSSSNSTVRPRSSRPRPSGDGLSTELEAGASCVFDIEYLPGQGTAQQQNDYLTIADNSLGTMQSTQQIPVIGQALPTPTAVLTPSPAAPIVYGQTTTSLGAQVTYTEGTPGGLVNFLDGENSLGSSISLDTGAATYPAQYYGAGLHSFQVNYLGDNNFSAVTSTPVAYLVNKATSSIIGPVITPHFAQYQIALIPVTVAGQYFNPGIELPSGLIDYTITNSSNIPVWSDLAPLINGAASVYVPELPAGSYTAALNYPGDSNYLAAAPTNVSFVIGTITPIIQWLAPLDYTYGQTLDLQAVATSSNQVLFTPIPGVFTFTAKLANAEPVAVNSLTILHAGQYTLTANFTPLDTTTYGMTSTTLLITVHAAAPLLSWAPPSVVPYGAALGSALDPTASFNATALPGVFTYSATPAGGTAKTVTAVTVLPSGGYTLTATFTPADTIDFLSTQTATVPVIVGKATPTILWPAPTSITFGTALTSVLNPTASFGSSAIPGTFTYTATLTGGTASAVSNTTQLGVGTYALTATFIATSATEYLPSTATIALTVNQATPDLKLASSANPVLLTNPTTLTATVSSSATAKPTGTVTFLDGTTPIGSASLTDGVATLAVSDLALGSHTLSVAYSGDTDFSSAADVKLTQSVIDLTAIPGDPGSTGGTSTPSQTIAPGGSATFTLAIVPSTGLTLPTATIFTISGMPDGATASVTPSTWAQTSTTSWAFPANTALANISLTIHLPSIVSLHRDAPLNRDLPPVFWGLLLIPFAGRFRRRAKGFGKTLPILLLLAASLGIVAGVTGCGGSSASPGQSYTILEKVTSGTLSHTAKVTLTVQ